jgi:type IV fimbrial biogenesis protein FimT
VPEYQIPNRMTAESTVWRFVSTRRRKKLGSVSRIFHNNPMKIRQIGFTLVELLVVVALAAILASLAVPSFRTLMVKRTVQAAADTLATDFRFARSEAVKRSTRTVICRSSDSTDCAGSAGSWSGGWIVFVDLNGDGTVDAGDDIVRVQQAMSGIATIHSDASPGGTRHTFNFEPTGWAKAADQTFNITPNGADGASFMRVACVSITGRAAIRAQGATTC